MSQTLTFQEAIATSSEWIRLWDAEELSDDVLADYVAGLIRHKDGARGFFVASLTDESPLMDRLPEPLVFNLRLAGKDVVDLITRNLAMSTAMVLQHEKNKNQELLDGSLRVKSRSKELLKVLEPNLVKERLDSMLRGEDDEFFDRWGYDLSQRAEIRRELLSIGE